MDWGIWWANHSDMVWGAVVGILATIVFGWLFYRLAEKPKVLGWRILSQTKLLQTSDSHTFNLEVRVDKREVSNPNITVLNIGNLGKQDITASDFIVRPLEITFSKGDFRAAEVTAASGQDALKGMIEILNDKFTIKPQLWKPGDWIELQLITDGDLVEPTVEARFAGGRLVRVSPYDPATIAHWRTFNGALTAFLFFACMLTGAMAGTLLTAKIYKLPAVEVVANSLFAGTLALLLLAAIVIGFRYYRSRDFRFRTTSKSIRLTRNGGLVPMDKASE